jgi:hypothetical protein
MAAQIFLLPALLTFLFTALRIFVVANIVGFILRVMVAFGLNIVLIEPAVSTIMGILSGQMGVLPPVAAAWTGFFNLDRYVGLIISAIGIQQAANFILKINR